MALSPQPIMTASAPTAPVAPKPPVIPGTVPGLPTTPAGPAKPPDIHTMPEEFRHGKMKMSKTVSPQEPVRFSTTPPPVMPPPAQPTRPPAQKPKPSKKKASTFKIAVIVVIIVVVLLILGVAGAFGYSYYISSQNANVNVSANQNVNVPVNTNVNVPVNTNANLNTNVIANVNLNTNANVNTNANTNFNINTNVNTEPAANIPSSRDSDRDSLTDVEERLFHTQLGRPDTDGDGYVDGKEVLSLYDPLSTGKITESEYIEPYTNYKYGYTIYLLEEWLAEPVDADDSHVLLTSHTGEFVEVIVEENAKNQTAKDWYLEKHQGVLPEDLEPIKVNGFEGIISPNKYSTYFAADKYIFTLNYNFGIKERVDFLTTYQMMARSFTFDKNNIKPQNTNTNTNTQ